MRKILLIIIFFIIFLLGLNFIDKKIVNTQENHQSNSANNTNPAYLYLVSAFNAMDQGEYPKAITLCKSAIAKDPNSKPAAICLIRGLIMNDNFNEANQALGAYKTKFGVDRQEQTEEARYYAITENYSAASALLNQLLQKNPTSDYLLDIKQYILDRTQLKK